MATFRRINGFTWPLDYRQVISWIFIIYFFLMFYGTLCLSMSDPWSYIIAIVRRKKQKKISNLTLNFIFLHFSYLH
jgi:hypothetical protein